MTVVIAAAVKPIIGKSKLAEERVRKVAEIYDHMAEKSASRELLWACMPETCYSRQRPRFYNGYISYVRCDER
ncbi:MAG: hypothetical protein CM1200mP39_30950 [Dehalococcoidia bacterium]|nr:MAG: hypothetical protein CM1200mP39_30950 [Dehalococcoidia bacterium]